MKSYTDIKQSKRLAEFLPLESADMWYQYTGISIKDGTEKPIYFPMVIRDCKSDKDVPCWSLSALIKMFDDKAGLAKDYGLWYCYDNGKSHCTRHYDDPIDAAFEMICWLLENGKI